MQDNNILDDLDLDNDFEQQKKLNKKFYLGLFFGTLIQFFLWVTLFTFPQLFTKNRIEIIDIEFLHYALELKTVGCFFIVMLLGSLSYLLLAGAKRQAFRKLLSMNFLFACGSLLGIAYIISSRDSEALYLFFLEHPFISITIVIIQFILLGSLSLLLRKEYTLLGVFLIFLTFFLIGFLQ